MKKINKTTRTRCQINGCQTSLAMLALIFFGSLVAPSVANAGIHAHFVFRCASARGYKVTKIAAPRPAVKVVVVKTVPKVVVKPAPKVIVTTKKVASPKKVWIEGHWKQIKRHKRVWIKGHWKVIR